MKKIFVLGLLFGCFKTEEVDVGRKKIKFFSVFHLQQSAIIGNNPKIEDGFKYGISILQHEKSSSLHYLVLERTFSKEKQVLLDSLSLHLNKDQIFITQVCAQNDVDDDAIVAIMNHSKYYSDIEIYRTMEAAFKIDLSTKKIKEIDPKKVSCYNESCSL